MADLLYLVTIVAFFALMVAFVRLCERIVGKDDALGADLGADAPDTQDQQTETPEEVSA